eukprot:gnl/TRDRNA2_/TRDRNA2_131782_c0_seq2.p1 gnl/TRDRNA2_/TRDRNA2_131782_c0~~gnl/TRDRNA2_/TRDRNA2_131782_c0_seq2.p1  ORF type:complete len:227 (+),score=24.47 gnl/TRDRNA2_/TRDRNA2_131782_c0_seq2:49-729(+)
MHVRHAEGLAHMICVIFLSMCWLAVTELVYDGPSVDHADEVALLQVKSSLAKVATTAPGGSLQAAISPELSQKVQWLKEQSHAFVSANSTTSPACPSSTTCQKAGNWQNVAQGAQNMAQKYCALHDKLYANHSQLHNWFDVDHDLYDKTSQGFTGQLDEISLMVFLLFKSGLMSNCADIGGILGGNSIGLSAFPAVFAMDISEFQAGYEFFEATRVGLRELGCACS